MTTKEEAGVGERGSVGDGGGAAGLFRGLLVVIDEAAEVSSDRRRSIISSQH